MGYPASQTKKATVNATDGTPITLVVPTNLPTQERADELLALYHNNVKPADPKSLRGPTSALVPTPLADDVAEAMAFVGDIVDQRTDLPDGQVHLYSKGYLAHGF